MISRNHAAVGGADTAILEAGGAPRLHVADRDIGPELPQSELVRLPRFILDTWRKILWELESDGNYGVCAATGHSDVADVRRSADDLAQPRDRFVALAPDQCTRDTSWRLVDDERALTRSTSFAADQRARQP